MPSTNNDEQQQQQQQHPFLITSPAPSLAASPHWSKLTQPPPNKKKNQFTPFIAFCFAVNYILGTGFLTMPWAFVQGGLIFSSVVLIMVCFFADMTKDYLLESMARAEMMLDPQMRWNKVSKNKKKKKKVGGDEERALLVYSPKISAGDTFLTEGGGGDLNKEVGVGLGDVTGAVYTSAPKIPPPMTSSIPGTPGGGGGGGGPIDVRGRLLMNIIPPNNNSTTSTTGPTEAIVKQRKFEVNTLCRVYLGKTGLSLYTLSVSLYIYGALWAYTSVFSSALASALPILGPDYDSNYGRYALIFASIVVPMSCLELEEQITAQVLLTACRFLMVFLMVLTSSLCAKDTGIHFHHDHDNDAEEEEAPLFQLGGMHKMLPILVFSTIYHHSIPGLSHPVSDKTKLGIIFRSTSIFSTVAYSFIGSILGYIFGNHIEQSSNLNWKGYHGGTGYLDEESGRYVEVAWWAKLISVFVLIFPAIDVISAFPLNAITLGNNLLGSYYGSKTHEADSNRRIRIQFRLLATVPPIILGILIRELGTITDYAGTTGFIITFTFPALLYIKSKQMAKKKNFPTGTYYSSYASALDCTPWVLAVFGVLMVLFVMIAMMTSG